MPAMQQSIYPEKCPQDAHEHPVRNVLNYSITHPSDSYDHSSTGATPYTCEYCHKAFRDPSVRSRHIEEQHLQKKTLHECSICAERDDGNSM